MIYTNISYIAERIRNTHEMFAEKPASEAQAILAEMVQYMAKDRATVGFTFSAMTDKEHGHLDTLITISRLGDGWEMIEQIRQEE